MHRRLSLLIALVALALAAAPASAQIIVPPPDILPITPGVFTDPDWLNVDYHRVTVRIDNQIAATNIDMQFTNEGDALAEGTFVFPLPLNATVDNLIMYIDGQAIESKILEAAEARAIYDEIVRQYRDPALLEYIGANAIQANVFPTPPGESRRIEIGYSQVLEAENGLVQYVYPLHAATGRTVDEMSIVVDVQSADEISAVYSPSHNVAVNRDGDTAFRAGFEANNFTAEDDYSLFYGLANESISVNLLTYRESSDESGFFMLLVQPPVEAERVVPKDVIVVLDQSGSMDGDKWTQAQDATQYVLENLNAEDRFNVIAFSTGIRVFADDLESTAAVEEAVGWVDDMLPIGGTDINLALTAAMEFADPERATTVLFLTDGLATEGEIETPVILDNVAEEAGPNVRIFTFGVGDDVDTVLLDSLVRDFRGASSYVRPTERIDEEVASLYNKVSAPVLTNIDLDLGDIRTDFIYPAGDLPDLFAGEQLTVVGRYRNDGEEITATLSGEVDGEAQVFTYEDLDFRARPGGEPFIARLWATRRIGELLNTIRLNGEDDELVDSVVSLSLRYGIITPYTSFLIEEDDILTQQGRARAEEQFFDEAELLANEASGERAVDAADSIAGFAEAEAPLAISPTAQALIPASESLQEDDSVSLGTGGSGSFDGDIQQQAAQNPIQTVAGKTFVLQSSVWTDTTFEPDTMTTESVVFLSDAYFALLDELPQLRPFFALGDAVIVVYEGTAYEVTPE